MKNISLKNYAVYALFCILTLLFLFVFVNKVRQEEIQEKSVLSGFLYEVKSDDFFDNIENYSIDNYYFLVYVSDGDDDLFEIKFKEYMTNYNLNLNIIYYNGQFKLSNDFVNVFKDTFFSPNLGFVKNKYLKQSNIYVFENGKVIDLLYDVKFNINIDDVKKFIERFDEFYD